MEIGLKLTLYASIILAERNGGRRKEKKREETEVTERKSKDELMEQMSKMENKILSEDKDMRSKELYTCVSIHTHAHN